MSCIKTGCHVFIEPYQMWAYGDAHEDHGGGTRIFRLCETNFRPIRGMKHFTVFNFDYWFDQEDTSQNRNSTMICYLTDVQDHGYDGVPL